MDLIRFSFSAASRGLLVLLLVVLMSVSVLMLMWVLVSMMMVLLLSLSLSLSASVLMSMEESSKICRFLFSAAEKGTFSFRGKNNFCERRRKQFEFRVNSFQAHSQLISRSSEEISPTNPGKGGTFYRGGVLALHLVALGLILDISKKFNSGFC